MKFYSTRFSFALLSIGCLIGFLFSSCLTATAFENLDFEDAMPVITGDDFGDCCGQSAEDLLPHWTTEYYQDDVWHPGDVYYNFGHIGFSPPIFKVVDNPVAYTLPPSWPSSHPHNGVYSLLIDSLGFPVNLFQEGAVPTDALSIQFSVLFLTFDMENGPFNQPLPSEDLHVYLGGEELRLLELAPNSTYRRFGANIPFHFAGSQAELRFSMFGEQLLGLDDIQFSPHPIPEPALLILFLIGSCALNSRRFVRQ